MCLTLNWCARSALIKSHTTIPARITDNFNNQRALIKHICTRLLAVFTSVRIPGTLVHPFKRSFKQSTLSSSTSMVIYINAFLIGAVLRFLTTFDELSSPREQEEE